MAMIMGTSFVQLCFSEQKLQLDGLWGPYDAPIIPDAWLLERGQTSAGSIVKWYMREFGVDKIHIFKVGKIMLIKQADLIKNAFSVDACAGAGTKN
ncbi:FGGY-family carbohydrate kinase, partial [Eubacterium callanderi]|uniref:FGGY-family carbohydrate kinase n=1 Tax=Eubacterium callanderi TaxID=53442 RepID=UPI003F73BEE9